MMRGETGGVNTEAPQPTTTLRFDVDQRAAPAWRRAQTLLGGSVSAREADGARPADSLAERAAGFLSNNLSAGIVLVAIMLGGLPVAVWMDLRSLSEHSLRDQANSFTSIIDSIRGYYATNIVGRVLANHGDTRVVPNYLDTPGAIPIPATLSLELGAVISGSNDNVSFRFFSDYPFGTRTPHRFDAFELNALTSLRENPDARLYDVSGSIFDRQVRLVVPILMSAECVSCHNRHPDSPKRDWKIGDVRGIQEISVRQSIAANIFAFKYLLGYFALVTVIGLTFIGSQRYQSAIIRRVNDDLGRANIFLSSVADKIAKYLSPQHYKSIFSGEKDAVIATERKKLTIFFSDIVGFTSTAERLQPEEFTALLNEYLTEMSAIAARHGGSVNKFIGDAMLIIFGDLDSRGVHEDARACLRMAFEMQRRLAELNMGWRRRGIEVPFQARMGINTGFCNVGNFGSDERMDYTIIGSEANLAARLQTIAQPGGVVLSYETYMLVRDIVRAKPLEAITLKGIIQPVIPYEVEGPAADAEPTEHLISEHTEGLDLVLDMRGLDRQSTDRVRKLLEKAVAALNEREAQPS
jgi:class 3 adenylate cyclase